MATIRAAWMTDLAAVLLPLQLKIMTVTSWVHGRHLALPVAPSSQDLTAVLLPLHRGIMTVTRRVCDGPLGPLALPAPPPPGQVNGSGARLHNVHPALLSTGAVSTPTPDIPIEGRGNKRVATMTAVLLLMHLVLMMV